jgi:hypothetical protein
MRAFPRGRFQGRCQRLFSAIIFGNGIQLLSTADIAPKSHQPKSHEPRRTSECTATPAIAIPLGDGL